MPILHLAGFWLLPGTVARYQTVDNNMALFAFAVLVLAIGMLVGIFIGFIASRLWGGNRKQMTKSAQALVKDAERAVHAERERSRTLYDLIATLTSSLNYRRVLNEVLDVSTNLLSSPGSPADKLVSAVFLFTRGEGRPTKLSVGSARRLTPADTRIELPGTDGILKEIIEFGEPCLSQNIAADPELSRMIALRACKVVYGIPLRAGLETYGVLLFAYPEANFFTPDRRDALGLVAHQAAIAIQNANLYHNLETEKERMLDIQEEARKKLARDLHDGPTQSIAAIAMRINFTRRLFERDPRLAMDELSKIEDLARRTTKEIRHMLFTLRPLVLESQGLIAALQTMAEKMRETYNQDVIINVDPNIIPAIETGKQAIIFYIAEEAVNNARKHAHAQHIYVRLNEIEKNMALLEIEDDGVGFNVEEVDALYEQRGSLGLVNMRERAELVNGDIRIDSEEGKGAHIRVIVPLTEEALDSLRSRKASRSPA
jgi:signal transduction histidine kinase